MLPCKPIDDLVKNIPPDMRASFEEILVYRPSLMLVELTDRFKRHPFVGRQSEPSDSPGGAR